MSLEDLGNIGEFVAAVAVLVSLIYLALQIRQNTRVMKSVAYQSVIALGADLASRFAHNERFCEIFSTAAQQLSSLTDAQQIQFNAHVMAHMRFYENLLVQHRQGMLDRDLWEAWSRDLSYFLSLPGFAEAWGRIRFGYSAAFCEYVDSRSKQPEQQMAQEAGGSAQSQPTDE